MRVVDVDQFWRVVEKSRMRFDADRRDGNMDAQLEDLEAELKSLTPEEVASFDDHFSELLHQTYRWDLWGAAYFLDGGCSDDAFMDFRYWLISMGRTVFEGAVADADSLAAVAFAPGVECCSFEEYAYVARRVYEAATGNSEIPTKLNLEPQIRVVDGKVVIRQPAGEKFDQDDLEGLRRRYPKIAWVLDGRARKAGA